jgi:hypothetical protein
MVSDETGMPLQLSLSPASRCPESTQTDKRVRQRPGQFRSLSLPLSLSFWLPDEILKRSLYMSIIWVTHLPSPLSASLRCTVQLVQPGWLDRERSPFFSSLSLSSRALLPQALVSVGAFVSRHRVRTQNGVWREPNTTPSRFSSVPAPCFQCFCFEPTGQKRERMFL